jgi:formamidopyrimidine-DNA glycosylase
MPELPEMENYRLLLLQKLASKTITNVEVNREKSINVVPEIFINNVKGHRITNIERKAKHLLFHLDNGHILLLHLMLGGWMFYGKEEDKPNRTIQIKLSFGNEHLYFIGLRLGYLHIFQSIAEVIKELSDLGPDPLNPEFTLAKFVTLIENRRGRLKTKLVNQQFLSGIGNCYSDEICFHAGIIPKRDLIELSSGEKKQLYESIHFILKDSIKHGGYMENPFFQGDTLTGGYNKLCKVYDREGESCLRCGSQIMKEMISSRKTFYCLNCQK